MSKKTEDQAQAASEPTTSAPTTEASPSRRRTLAALEELGLSDRYGRPPAPHELAYRPENPADFIGPVRPDQEYMRVTVRDGGYQAQSLVREGFVPDPESKVRLRGVSTPDEVMFVRSRATGDAVRSEERRRRASARAARSTRQTDRHGATVTRDVASEAGYTKAGPPLRD